MSRPESYRRKITRAHRQSWPAAIILALLLLSACGGGLSRNDAASFSKGLGDQLQQQNYSKAGPSYDPKQVALAQQSGFSIDEVAGVMLGLQHNLVGNYVLDANFAPAPDLMSEFDGSDQLTGLASDRLGTWLIQQGKVRVQSKLEDFLNKPDQQQLDALLKVADANGMEYGYFTNAGTFWFRNSVTSKFAAVAFLKHNGARLAIVIEGVVREKAHPKYRSITSFEATINQVDMWREEEQGQPPLIRSRCCEKNTQQLTVVSSIDPNDLLSDPAGFGSAAYIAEDQIISYTIRFENPESAQATASDLTVIAELGAGIDLASVLLGPSSHPAGMTAEISESNRSITWFFEDIMLPPNQTSPEGEGWIRFSARPLADVASGTSISAKAAIRFDYSPPIETNEIIYTVDSAAPATQVHGMAPVQLSPSFEISWGGSDESGGSGLQDVTLLVSEDGGPFSVLGAFSEQSFPFQGEIGKTYGFATVGIDQVGHPEAIPAQPDATVTVGQLLSPEPGWQLVGVPVIAAQSPPEELSKPGTAWSVWDSAEQAYLSVGLQSADWPVDNFALPGSGLWASFDADTSYYITGQAVPIDQPYSIELQLGWNLIANPFPVPVTWDLNAIRVSAAGVDTTLADAQARDWVEDFAWGWNGHAYSLVYDSQVVAGVPSTLEPFKGYWFQAHQDATLILPPPTVN
ncbi:MAG: hypothetical protein O2909_08320 [Chloroflexi bacterium]|nr:hypothetical protein [Chloroflexota bacterium]MDA1219433.1 hypothetical protein [Chloroflexota bacterium]